MVKDLRVQRRLAAEILKVGINRIVFDRNRLKEISEAVTREDIKRLIEEGAIKARKEKGISRGRVREREKKKRKRGHGKRKGKKTARYPRKKMWINKIRAQRRILKELRDKGVLDRKTYRKLYLMAKGGYFRSKAHLLEYVKQMVGENDILKEIIKREVE